MTSAIQKEFIKATGVKPRKNEDRADYLQRLTVAVSEIEEGDWEDLSEGAQEWFNDEASTAYENQEPIPEFPDMEEEEEEEAEAPKRRGRPAKKVGKKVAKKAAKKVAKKAAKKAGKKATAKASSNGGGRTAIVELRKMVIENPDMKPDDLVDASGSVSRGTAVTIRYQTLATMKVLRDMGKMKRGE